ncbi:hypothetical protein HQ529_01375, partial [Candidatus Woesearchaeota archaeon]|nr:hypothetical protein [Candidatus Woesearchaeota archaeon]
DVDYKVEGNKHIWTFTASTEAPKITYSVMLPAASTGVIDLKTDYTLPDAEGTVSSKVTVSDEEWGYQQETTETFPDQNSIDQEIIEGIIIEEQSVIRPWMIITAIAVVVAIVVLLFIFKSKKPEEVDEYEA